MKLSISSEELREYVSRQIKAFFPDRKTDKGELIRYWEDALDRTEYCFNKVKSKYFWDGYDVTFNHLNADQYAMFLYILSNTLYRNNSDRNLCTKIFQLNRYLHSIDVFFEVKLPDIFLFVHTIGTVLGRAVYSDYLIVYQHCNVGGSTNADNQLVYPTIKKYVTMHPGTSILGDCTVGENCTLAAGSLLLNQKLERDNLYIGNPRNYIVKKREVHHYAWKTESEEG
jgi:serine O-acetyltransferase